jgi:Mce-associated membrane protein
VSPRRKLQPGEEPVFSATPPRSPRRWGLPVVAMLAAMLAAAAITVCAGVLNSHAMQRRTTLRQAAALSYVCSFMTEFASPDPFHANDYTDRVLAEATGDFAEQYRHNQKEILIQVASADPTTGTVLGAGVSRWNDDGSVDVLVMTKFTSKSPDGKFQLERASRWVVTAKQEGGSWKISSLTPMI